MSSNHTTTETVQHVPRYPLHGERNTGSGWRPYTFVSCPDCLGDGVVTEGRRAVTCERCDGDKEARADVCLACGYLDAAQEGAFPGEVMCSCPPAAGEQGSETAEPAPERERRPVTLTEQIAWLEDAIEEPEDRDRAGAALLERLKAERAARRRAANATTTPELFDFALTLVRAQAGE